ncbi:MAG TPA: hypothetical protein VM305_02255 [Candidatus Limnocylindrales bacterium]|nr:hypothetical protein [Candidatus Limnocylindrales bacterium]
MHHSLAAIRTGHPASRFTVPSSPRRLPRLGRARPGFAPVACYRTGAAGGPRDRLRRATRGCATVGPRRLAGMSAQRSLRMQRAKVRWTHHVEGSLRHARPRSAAPWRA